MAQVAIAAAHGREHPVIAAWLARHDLPLAGYPPYPGRVLCSALTSNDSRRVVREKLRKYLPAGSKWRNEHGDGEAEVQLPAWGGHRGGVIVCKSNDQGRRAYQGDEFDVILLDEEHDQDVYRECLMRLGRRRWRAGWIGLFMTPLNGLTWVHEDFVGRPLAGNVATWLHGADNPHADQRRRAQLLAQYGEHERAARDRGEFRALEGRVYPAWRRDLHVAEPPPPPDGAEWYAAIDWGTRNPTAYLLAYRHPADDVLYIVAEHYQAETLLVDHAAAIRRIEADHGARDVTRWADPEDRQSCIAIVAEHDIGVAPASKAIRTGINAVAERLARDVSGRPHLVVAPSCVNLCRELDSYVWATRGGDRDQPDMPLKRDDHAADALRYLCLGVRLALGWMA
jgi:phage terminase large subunit-like protein